MEDSPKVTDASRRIDMPNESDRTPNSDECLVPPPVQPETLEKYLLKRAPFDGADEVRQYVEGQSPLEEVTCLQRVTSERVIGRDHDIWDVHTTGERYWVITNPTNLYSQRLFPSADYTLSFHVGLMARVMSRREPGVDADGETLLASAWRRWRQAPRSRARSAGRVRTSSR